MATGKKRTGTKNAHKKAKFAAHFAKAEKNKQRRIEKDKREKEKSKLKKHGTQV